MTKNSISRTLFNGFSRKNIFSFVALSVVLSLLAPSASITSASAAKPGETTYSVTYDANGATGGTAPVDGATYAKGASVSLAAPGNNFKKSGGYSFGGWSLGGQTYQPGDSYIVGTSNMIFSAVWQNSAAQADQTAANNVISLIGALTGVLRVLPMIY